MIVNDNLLEDSPLVFHPLPVPARCCGTILQATYAEENDYCCPNCGAEVCYTCGCSYNQACASIRTTADHRRQMIINCSWYAPGTCSFCYWRAAYEFYQEATGRVADDPFYLAIGQTVRAVKGLGWGIGI